jgi:lactaldehyde dehydrogenase/glycolaldehyde dehydrogenase
VLDDLALMLSDGQPATLPMYVGGRWVEAGTRSLDAVEDPATGRAVAHAPAGTVQDAEEALEAARAAQPAWAALPAVERGRAVHALADEVAREADLLARVVVAEQGKPLGQARGEIGATETFLRYAAEWARRIEGEILPADARTRRSGSAGCPTGSWRG